MANCFPKRTLWCKGWKLLENSQAERLGTSDSRLTTAPGVGAVEARPAEPAVLSLGALLAESDALRSAVTATRRRRDQDRRRGTCSGRGPRALRAPGVGINGWISACLRVWQPGIHLTTPLGAQQRSCHSGGHTHTHRDLLQKSLSYLILHLGSGERSRFPALVKLH